MDGFASCFAHDIPDRHIDATHHMHHRTETSIVIGLCPHIVPYLFIVEGIRTYNHFF